jgi:hypothetical protein
MAGRGEKIPFCFEDCSYPLCVAGYVYMQGLVFPLFLLTEDKSSHCTVPSKIPPDFLVFRCLTRIANCVFAYTYYIECTVPNCNNTSPYILNRKHEAPEHLPHTQTCQSYPSNHKNSPTPNTASVHSDQAPNLNSIRSSSNRWRAAHQIGETSRPVQSSLVALGPCPPNEPKLNSLRGEETMIRERENPACARPDTAGRRVSAGNDQNDHKKILSLVPSNSREAGNHVVGRVLTL